MPPINEDTVKSVEIVVTISVLSVAGLITLCKVVICEFIDSVYDVKEKKLERRRKIEEHGKGAGI